MHFPQWRKVEKILSLIPTTVIRRNISRNKTSLCCPSQESEQHWVAGVLPKHEDFWGLPRDKKFPLKLCQGSIQEGFSGTGPYCRAVCAWGQRTFTVGSCSWEVSFQDLCVLVQWSQLRGMGLYATNTASPWQFHSVLREWFSLGLLQMSWNCCFLWEKRRSRRERCFEPLSAALPGFEASALGTAGGRGLWSEEGTRQGTEGLLLLQCVCSRPRGCLFASGSCFSTGCVGWNCQQCCSSSWCAFEVGLKPVALLTPPERGESQNPREMKNEGGGDVWQHCWTVGISTEQQERTEWRSAAGDSISLLWVSTGVGQVSPQCLQLWSLPVVTGVTGMSFPLGPEALPPSDQDLADARLGLHLAR